MRLIPNKEKLEELINKAKALDLTKYTEDSVEIFKIEQEVIEYKQKKLLQIEERLNQWKKAE